MEKIYYFFHHGILFLSYLLACLAMTTTNITTDQSSLLALIDHITPDEILAKNWSVKSSVCEWLGVTCGSRHQRVTALNISNMGLTGTIPPQLGNLSFLVSLDMMSTNNFHGELPPELANLRRLKLLNFGYNNLDGVIPYSFGWLQKLQKLSLRNNGFRGSIPPSIFNISRLEKLWLSFNFLEEGIPAEIGNLQKLKNLIIESNQLSGSLPSVIFNISSLEAIALANNSLSGSLPVSVCDHLQRLYWLTLFGNKLQGQIPSTFSNCTQLQVLVLHGNDFSGFIPREIGDLRMLTGLSLGSTNLKGLIPKDIGNLTMLTALDIVDSGIAGKIPEELGNLYMLERLVLEGSIGSVYKGTLKNGILVAVKVFNLQLEITHKSFISECEVLRSLRHRNLIKVVSACSNDDFKALVLEYMPNGSLEKWLHSHKHYLDLKQRISIMVDVACALEYLHHGGTIPVVHCDLKPANILLDEDMVAHLGDFGLAKLLDEEQSGLHTKTLATLGYIAPEYGSEGLVSTRSDVYSFGIVLMETFSRMKPSDEIFSEDLNLKSWIEDSLHGAIIQVIDAKLLTPEDIHLTKKLEYISLILELALSCCKECPADRMSMKDVVVALEKIKHQVLSVCGDQI